MATKTPQQIAAEKQLAAFLKVAVTRSGVPYKVSSLQKDSRGNINMLKGTITPEGGAPETMYWSPDGQAFAGGNSRDYDLVEEMSLEDLFGENAEEVPQ